MVRRQGTLAHLPGPSSTEFSKHVTEATAPPSICLLRLSALGDVTHVLPLLRTLRKAWPQAAIAWVIGKGEHRLLAGLPGVRFIEYDKQSGLGGMIAPFCKSLLAAAFIPARRRIGYDRSRSKDGHGLFINERIADRPGLHVLDAIGSFADALGLQREAVAWDLPVPGEAHAWATRCCASTCAAAGPPA